MPRILPTPSALKRPSEDTVTLPPLPNNERTLMGYSVKINCIFRVKCRTGMLGSSRGGQAKGRRREARPRQGMAGHGRAWQVTAGQGKARQGREGQGRQEGRQAGRKAGRKADLLAGMERKMKLRKLERGGKRRRDQTGIMKIRITGRCGKRPENMWEKAIIRDNGSVSRMRDATLYDIEVNARN
eukprot:754298-Hanusia_phi.AAC.1